MCSGEIWRSASDWRAGLRRPTRYGAEVVSPVDGAKHGRVDLNGFTSSLDRVAPPRRLAPAVVALWHAAKGDWDKAHEIAQRHEDAACCWVHAYLHRVEDDERNAGLWYSQAGKPFPEVSLEEEWRHIAATLLEHSGQEALSD